MCLIGQRLHSALDCQPQQFTIIGVYCVGCPECLSVFPLYHEENDAAITCLNNLHQFSQVFLSACCNGIREQCTCPAEKCDIFYLHVTGADRSREKKIHPAIGSVPHFGTNILIPVQFWNHSPRDGFPDKVVWSHGIDTDPMTIYPD